MGRFGFGPSNEKWRAPFHRRPASEDSINSNLTPIKEQILIALAHPEAEEGLYLRNLAHLHEEDERPAVEASDEDIVDALDELIEEGKVKADRDGKEIVFILVRH